ncbi:hypothetical protein F4813DRAFT_157268 [Daldinia decipiens]|uniref:uncharacterized protein n=1 Tax=Daldinia decipiens TaxID=326647 RepID=UPI0020C496CD|nr:uncharacterized protein F4813DRAFT_157268 [Daldinia decipiens]KAI1655645.1 hypothetical protein F4813DRAFT_157268 [Daldinia decipiens]
MSRYSTRLVATYRWRGWLLLVQLTYKTVNGHANAFYYLHSAHTPHPSSHDNSTIRQFDALHLGSFSL